jgi:hypothetical protein
MTLGPGDPFRNVGGRGIKLKEMLDLAAHIGHTKPGHFDLSRLEDRYENALIDLLPAKTMVAEGWYNLFDSAGRARPVGSRDRLFAQSTLPAREKSFIFS